MDPGKVNIVLHRPSSAENIGAAARAMKNFGLSNLAIVSPLSWSGIPREGGPGSAREAVLARARKTARRASDLLESAAVYPDARSALATATWCCGTTSRAIEGRPRLSPRELAREIAARSRAGQVSVLFGEERRGLSDRELGLCHAVCTIPTTAAYDSMNLAQSVAVLAYEISSADRSHAAQPAPRAGAEPARHATTEALWDRLADLFAMVGYTNPQNPEHILADWRQLLSRAEPTQREVELLVAAARAIERKLRLREG